MASVIEEAMLVQLKISSWTNSRKDKTATTMITTMFENNQTAARVVKELIDPVHFKEIRKASNELRAFHAENTMPWDTGVRLLPQANYEMYSAGMDARKTAFQNAVEDFLPKYPDLAEEAKVRLGKLWDETDYPNKDEIAVCFDVQVQFTPVPSEGHFRLSMLSEKEQEKIKEGLTAHLKEKQAEAMKDTWTRLYTAVSHMAERLEDPDTLFRDSMVTNIGSICELLPKFNLTDDPRLIKMGEIVKEHLLKHKPDALRKDPALREKTAKAAAAIVGGLRKIQVVI